MENEKKNKRIKLVCNLTGVAMSIDEDYYAKKVKQYESEDNLKKFYIQNKIITMIKKGRSIEDLAALFGFAVDSEKIDYYNELVAFHNKDNSMLKQPKKESKTTITETDERVKNLINKWKDANNE